MSWDLLSLLEDALYKGVFSATLWPMRLGLLGSSLQAGYAKSVMGWGQQSDSKHCETSSSL